MTHWNSTSGDNPAVAGSRGSLGVVVPVFNEARTLAASLDALRSVTRAARVVVVDGGSSDASASIAAVRFETLQCTEASRGLQMNLGARHLDSDALLFLHADSRLSAGYEVKVTTALATPSVAGGCFRLEFDQSSPMLDFYAWCTRFSGRYLHFGDQGIFIRRSTFESMGGFRNLVFLEDVDLLKRMRRHGRFVILPDTVVTSARRFRRFGPVRQQLLNILIVSLFELGVSARHLARLYPPVR